MKRVRAPAAPKRIRAPAARRRGVTLMELVVVLAIIGIVLGVAGPAFIVRGESVSDDAAAPVVRLLARARRTAIESARTTIVTIDPSTARAWVRTDGREPNVDTSFTLALARDTGIEAAVPRPRFVFDARGGAFGDALTLVSPAGRAAISLDRASGDVHVTVGANGVVAEGSHAP